MAIGKSKISRILFIEYYLFLDLQAEIDNPEAEKKEAPKAALSIVDIASAAINGRSAAAALAGSSEKNAAHVAAHAAGSLIPVNTRLV